jgi:hypothetical protein
LKVLFVHFFKIINNKYKKICCFKLLYVIHVYINFSETAPQTEEEADLVPAEETTTLEGQDIAKVFFSLIVSCFLMPNEQFFRYTMARTSYI